MSKREYAIKEDTTFAYKETTIELKIRFSELLENKSLNNIEIAAINCIVAALDYQLSPSQAAEEKIKTHYTLLGIELEKLNHANPSFFTSAKKSINNLNQIIGYTPAHLIMLAIAYDASNADPRAMLLALDKCRPNLNLKTSQGDSCLHILLKAGSAPQMLKWLMARKADIAIPDKAGDNAVHLLTKKYNRDDIEGFLRFDLEKAYSLINEKNDLSQTPQSIFSQRHKTDITDLFFNLPENEFFQSSDYMNHEQHLFSIN